MRKIFLSLGLCICLGVGMLTVGCNDKTSDESAGGGGLDPISATLETWSAPESFGRNDAYKVEVSADGESWEELEVYNVKNGHQKGDPLINQGGATYFGEPYTASLVTFDFTGTVGVRVTSNKTKLAAGGYVLSPASYEMKSVQEGDIVTFTLTQSAESPRKVVFRPAGNWEADCLQIMTNVPEGAYKEDAAAANVYVVEEGETVPLSLPEGKDTYYFKKGMHTLPGGYWVDLDLGKTETVKSFDLMTPALQAHVQPGGVCFEIQARNAETEPFETVYQSLGEDAENNFNLENVALSATARYFRLILHGNFNWTPLGDYRYIHTARIKEFRLYNEKGDNVALKKAVAGAGKNYAAVTDGTESESYGHTYAGETFSARSGYTYYLEKGAVLEGSFIGENAEGVTISGRGILDGSKLESTHELSEGRNGSIHFEHCQDVVVEGITIMHAPMWMLVVNYSRNVLVSGVNLFGYCTNADGIHFSASTNAKATGCFIRTTDDLFVAYHYGDANHLVFENSVLWSDGGRVLLLGLANTGNIQGVTLKNCDVITYQNVWNLADSGGFAQIVATGGKKISDVRIEDVRIDEVRFPVIAQFLQIRAGIEAYGTGFVENVSLKNVSYASECKPKSLISVAIPGGSVSGVSFAGVSIRGETLTAENLAQYFHVDKDVAVSFK